MSLQSGHAATGRLALDRTSELEKPFKRTRLLFPSRDGLKSTGVNQKSALHKSARFTIRDTQIFGKSLKRPNDSSVIESSPKRPRHSFDEGLKLLGKIRCGTDSNCLHPPTKKARTVAFIDLTEEQAIETDLTNSDGQEQGTDNCKSMQDEKKSSLSTAESGDLLFYEEMEVNYNEIQTVQETRVIKQDDDEEEQENFEPTESKFDRAIDDKSVANTSECVTNEESPEETQLDLEDFGLLYSRVENLDSPDLKPTFSLEPFTAEDFSQDPPNLEEEIVKDCPELQVVVIHGEYSEPMANTIKRYFVGESVLGTFGNMWLVWLVLLFHTVGRHETCLQQYFAQDCELEQSMVVWVIWLWLPTLATLTFQSQLTVYKFVKASFSFIIWFKLARSLGFLG